MFIIGYRPSRDAATGAAARITSLILYKLSALFGSDFCSSSAAACDIGERRLAGSRHAIRQRHRLKPTTTATTLKRRSRMAAAAAAPTAAVAYGITRCTRSAFAITAWEVALTPGL